MKRTMILGLSLLDHVSNDTNFDDEVFSKTTYVKCIKVSAYCTCRPTMRQQMDERTGVVVYKEHQESGRTTSNEMAQHTNINVRVGLDANKA